jgi:hypothetical protein
MGYYHCPIEPNDWTDGPDYEEQVECSECNGDGELAGDDNITETCRRCDGTSFVDPPEYEPFDDDVL